LELLVKTRTPGSLAIRGFDVLHLGEILLQDMVVGGIHCVAEEIGMWTAGDRWSGEYDLNAYGTAWVPEADQSSACTSNGFEIF
jgi:hypothetical protein